MKIRALFLAVACGSALLLSTNSKAAEAKTYQVTGPVLEITPTTFIVQKNDEKWEIARDKNTKINGELKVGTKVTVYYRMIAAEVEIKDTKTSTKSSTKPGAEGDKKK
jgi:hypothetical protein